MLISRSLKCGFLLDVQQFALSITVRILDKNVLVIIITTTTATTHIIMSNGVGIISLCILHLLIIYITLVWLSNQFLYLCLHKHIVSILK